ncbi:MAG: glycosyltransferase family 2 protein, partial [Gaiellaceae bacterium]
MRRAAAVAALGGGLVVVEIVLRGQADLKGQVAGQMVAFGLFLPAAWLVWRGLGMGRAGVVLVLGIALVLRAAAFDPSATPPLSSDINRYAWDARVQAAGINPYRYPTTDPALARLRDSRIWPAINHPTWRTNYPPGAEASFIAARAAFGHGLRATTWLYLLAEAAALSLIVFTLQRMRAPPERVLLAAWHPLAVSEIAANGHVDALALLAGASLLAALSSRRTVLAGIAIGLGTLVKLGPFLLLPALARREGRRFVLAALGVVGVGYLAYASVGARVTGTEIRLLRHEDIGSFAWKALVPLIGADEARYLLLTILLVVVAVVSLRTHDTVDQVARTALLVLGGEILATNYLQPWYGLWLLPFLAVTAAPAWLWLTGTLPLLYVFGIEQALPWWVRFAIYGPFFVLVLARLVRPSKTPPIPLAPLPASPRIVAVIPTLNEVAALPRLLAEFPADTIDEVIVVDGGSTDGTLEAARAAGARVVVEPRRGYGRACLTGADAAAADIVVFLDGDGSDDPKAIPQLLEPVLAGRAALVLGSRGQSEVGGQHLHQQLGNRLVSWLVGRVYGVHIRDIPPLRAVRQDALSGLNMVELTYGWPTEMVVKAARAGLPIAELSVTARARRGGESKVSGRLVPSLKAGARMLTVVARH